MRLLLFICLFASTAFAQLDNVAFLGATATAAAAATCKSWLSTSAGNGSDYWIYSGVLSQKIQNAGTLSVCKVKVYLDTTGGNSDVAFSLRSAANKGGSLYGTTETITTTGIGNGWFTLNFSSPVSVTGDFFLTFESSSDTAMRWRVDTAGIYDSTTYCIYTGPNPYTAHDFMFEIWTMQ